MLILINYNYFIEGFVILESIQDLYFIIKCWFIELSKKLAKFFLIEKKRNAKVLPTRPHKNTFSSLYILLY